MARVKTERAATAWNAGDEAKNTTLHSQKKKSSTLDKPQPAGLSPSDSEDLVLSLTEASKQHKKQEEAERLTIMNHLEHKPVSSSTEAAPPAELLSLVEAFLTSYGFNSASRLFRLERNMKTKTLGWDDAATKKLKKGSSDLVKIYRDFKKNLNESQGLGDVRGNAEANATSSDEVSSADDKSSGEQSDESSNSDDSDEAAPKKKATKETIQKVTKKSKGSSSSSSSSTSSSSSSSSSNSDSDADDEEGPATTKQPASRSKTNGVNKLKRKSVSSSSESSSESGKSSSSSSEEPAAKKTKKSVVKEKPAPKPVVVKAKGVKTKETANKVQATSSSEETSSDSDSDSDLAPTAPKSNDLTDPIRAIRPSGITKAERQTSTDSSKTLEGSPEKARANDASSSDSMSSSDPSDSEIDTESVLPSSKSVSKKAKRKPKVTVSSSSSSSSSSDTSSDSDNEAAPPKSTVVTPTIPKRKLSSSPTAAIQSESAKLPKKTNTPFSRIPIDTKVDAKFSSNKYVPNDYSNRAYQDLVVTKGKGFTKEKNKKKRGSYRGGVIDTSGGKGIKFDD